MLNQLTTTEHKEILEALQAAAHDYLYISISVSNSGHSIMIVPTDSTEIDQDTWNGYDFILECDYDTEDQLINLIGEEEPTFDTITNEMLEGNWSKAQELYKQMNPTAREFSDYMEQLAQSDSQPMELLQDWSLLGFYARDYKGGN